jgi:lipopolysaccharide/colanic/teichoic acid biosynthesis glycosyltransferase
MRALIRLLVPISTAVVVFGFGLAHAAWIGHYPFSGTARITWSIAYVVLTVAAAESLGLPNIRRRSNALMSSLASTTLAAVGISVIQLTAAAQLLPRFVVFASALALTLIFTVLCFLSETIRQRSAGRDRVLVIVDDAHEITRLNREVEREVERSLLLAGTRTMSAIRDMQRTHEEEDGPDLVSAVHASLASVLVLDRVAQEDPWVISQASRLHAEGVRIRTLSLFYDQWLGKLPVNELQRVSLLFDINELHSVRYARTKRALDVSVATVGCIALAIVAVVVWLLNFAFNPGPLLYRQQRIGKHGIEFTILKFRTMPPHDGPSDWTSDSDPRLGRFGRMLRQSHLDELPQVMNVLKGELSIVGPRPEQPRYVSELSGTIPFYDVRHLVLPGITGWAQVKYSYGASALDSLEKLQYDFFYLRHQSFVFDMRIIGRTVNSILRRRGR